MSKTWTFKTFGEDGEVVTTHQNLSNTEAATLIEDAMRGGGADRVRHTAAGRDEDRVAELTPREELQLVA